MKTRNSSTREKFKIFGTLLSLYFKSKFSNSDNTVVSHHIGGYVIYAYDYPTLISLYVEIFLDQVYYFKTDNSKPLIIDCGANIGMSLLYFKKIYPQCEVWAYEANPNAFSLLKRNVEENKLKNVRLYNYALSDKNEEVNFYIPFKKGSLNGSLDANYSGGNKHKMQAYRLSDLLLNKEIDFIKIDIEGAENSVIKDLYENNCLKNINQFIIEYHQQKNNSTKFLTFVAYFESNGFNLIPEGETCTINSAHNMLLFQRK